VEVSQTFRGLGYWKFNTSLCHDPKYIDLIKNSIRVYGFNNSENHVNPHINGMR